MDQTTLIATAFKMTISLGAVLLTFGAALLIARKFSGASPSFMKKMGTRKSKPMEVLAFQSLGPGRGLYLIRCLDKQILVGATAHSISQIADMRPEDSSLDEEFGNSLSEKLTNDSSSESSRQNKSRINSDHREVSRV